MDTATVATQRVRHGPANIHGLISIFFFCLCVFFFFYKIFSLLSYRCLSTCRNGAPPPPPPPINTQNTGVLLYICRCIYSLFSALFMYFFLLLLWLSIRQLPPASLTPLFRFTPKASEVCNELRILEIFIHLFILLIFYFFFPPPPSFLPIEVC